MVGQNAGYQSAHSQIVERNPTITTSIHSIYRYIYDETQDEEGHLPLNTYTHMTGSLTGLIVWNLVSAKEQRDNQSLFLELRAIRSQHSKAKNISSTVSDTIAVLTQDTLTNPHRL
jgi:hypothetical protein